MCTEPAEPAPAGTAQHPPARLAGAASGNVRPVGGWETAHGVELPEPYRTFVAEVSNGALEAHPLGERGPLVKRDIGNLAAADLIMDGEPTSHFPLQ
ncbi:hypothetical protein HRW23_29100 [Streptomyces lunaelactis]|uniref:hypothetical protein n=1 Tax=Streptomyces lunaelactis TaxID=1535768 RepID=UPI00158550AF|nr:hypothetical protein [Streptomyces lunaelactis]NUK35194.1 hypothetical protein [Streptomyces lunaelactis]NUK44596.1 hypothetical protein [Streptomyces lunaelactis]NUK50250.1 hypothetical protein [Streptomyces lunaelactis]NUK64576.1 hypothetical protein [Streptomyces lunaelactis]NUK72239.1 hypothetical protein [Streptomyces lunaelactis]